MSEYASNASQTAGPREALRNCRLFCYYYVLQSRHAFLPRHIGLPNSRTQKQQCKVLAASLAATAHSPKDRGSHRPAAARVSSGRCCLPPLGDSTPAMEPKEPCSSEAELRYPSAWGHGQTRTQPAVHSGGTVPAGPRLCTTQTRVNTDPGPQKLCCPGQFTKLL